MLNCSLHTKKTNNTNKLTFFPYKNSKITKVKKKKRLFLYRLKCLKSAGTKCWSFGTGACTSMVSYPLPCPSPPTPQEFYTFRVTITTRPSGKSESVNGINLCHFF